MELRIANGTITVNGGTIRAFGEDSYNDAAIYNTSTGNIIVNNGTLIGSDYGIYNLREGTVFVTGGEVIGEKGNAIYNKSEGLITVIGGVIKSNSSTNAIMNGSTGTIVIGTKDNEIITQKYPVIIGEKYGLLNEKGNVKFYNGIIQAKVRALDGSITQVRDGYKIKNEFIDEMNSIYLVEKEKTEYVAQVDSVKFYSIKEAIDSINENDEKTIKILKTFELEESILCNKKIILDLNGYKITNKYYQIKNTGNLKIIDTSIEQTGEIENISTLSTIINEESSNLELNGGTIKSSNNFIYNNSENCVIYNSGEGNVIISGGKIIGSCESIIYNNGGRVKLSDVMVNGEKYGIWNINGILEMSGGSININGNSSLNYGIYNNYEGSVTINEGTINVTYNGNSSDSVYGIYNNTGNITINEGIVTASGTGAYNTVYGIYNSNTGTITIYEGDVISSSNSRNSYGVYNRAKGTIILGNKGDGLVSQEKPNIKSECLGTSTSYVGHGIYNTNGSLYIYDGIIEGTTKAVYDKITEIEEDTELNYQNNEKILTLSTEIMDVAKVGTITYKTIQEAIDSITTTEQTTIEILRNAAFTNKDSVITIPSNKNIKINLKGYRIVSAIPQKMIQNEGILEITDTSENQEGKIVSTEETTISNLSTGTLTISSGTIENRKKQTIYNEGTTKIVGGLISSNQEDTITYNNENYGIYNAATGNIEISGGTVNISNNNYNSYTLYNENSGKIKVIGGTVSNSSSDNSYGIYNASTGNIEVVGGTINSNTNSETYNSYGIYNANTGKIIIGAKGDETLSQETPIITSEYGIYNQNGTLNFYDGTIKGTTKTVYGNISEVEDLTELLITSDNTYKIIQLQQKETSVAEVNGTQYDSIQEAILACGTTEGTIKILRNSEPGATIVIGENQNITIDLNGYTTKNYIELKNKGTLKITDTSTSQNGKLIGLLGTVVINTGTMEVKGGSIADSGYGIDNKGILNITGGSIANNTYGIYNNTNGVTNVSSGIISSNTYGIYNYAGTTNVIGTGITNNEYGIYVVGGTTNIKEGAQVQSNIGTYAAAGRLNIGETGTMNSSSPVIIGEEYGLVVSATGIVNMYDGQIKGKSGATQGYITNTETGYVVGNKVEGEYFVDYLALAGTISTVAQVNGIDYSNLQSAINSIVGEGTVLLTNGIITDTTFTIREGQNIILDMNGKTISSDLDITINNEGSLTIIDSTGSGVGKISSTVGTAIVNSGTLTLGEDDGTVNQELITIEGTTYGIENSGTLNFYDGTINGGSAISGAITNRATGYVIRTTTVNGKERYYLSAS